MKELDIDALLGAMEKPTTGKKLTSFLSLVWSGILKMDSTDKGLLILVIISGIGCMIL